MNRHSTLLVALSIAAGFTPSTAWAVDCTWNGSFSDNWNNAANWTPNQVPGTGDTATLPAGNNAVVINTSVAISGLTIGTGSFLSVSSGGELNLEGDTSLSGSLTNNGTVNWKDGGISMIDDGNNSSLNGVITNSSGGVFDIMCNQSMTNNNFAPRFLNAGTLRKSAGTGVDQQIDAYLDNASTSTVEVMSGTLLLGGGGKLGGTFTAASGAAFCLVSGNFELSNTPHFQGPGKVGINGEVILTGALSGTFGFYAGGNLNTGSFLTVASGGELTIVNASTLYGSLDIAAGGVLNITSSLYIRNPLTNAGTINIDNTLYIYSPLTNAGTMEWTGGDIKVYNNANDWTGDITNTASGVIHAPGSGSIFLNGSPVGALVVTSHDNMIVAASNSMGTRVNFTLSASGGIGTAVTSTPASGSVFPLGGTPVHITARDALGNTATGSFTVTVVGIRTWSLVPAGPATNASLSGTVRGGPNGSVKLQASTDLGLSDTWRDIGTIGLDETGNATFGPVQDPNSSGLSRDFFRVRLP